MFEQYRGTGINKSFHLSCISHIQIADFKLNSDDALDSIEFEKHNIITQSKINHFDEKEINFELSRERDLD